MIARAAMPGVVLVLASAAPALACSSCFYGSPDGMLVYLATAAFMSVLPLAMAGGVALWLRRRLRGNHIGGREAAPDGSRGGSAALGPSRGGPRSCRRP